MAKIYHKHTANKKYAYGLWNDCNIAFGTAAMPGESRALQQKRSVKKLCEIIGSAIQNTDDFDDFTANLIEHKLL